MTITALSSYCHNTKGYAFGGYATQTWKSGDGNNDVFKLDQEAFLFTIRKNNKKNFVKYPANNAAIISCRNGYYGPEFGRYDSPTSGSYGLSLFSDIVKKGTDGTYEVHMYVDLSNGFNNHGHSDNEFHGGDTKLFDIEVFELSGKRPCLEYLNGE